mgnify:CR=1 FL=1
MHHYNLELGSHLVNILVTNISCVFVERNSNLNFVETSALLPNFILLETLGSNDRRMLLHPQPSKKTLFLEYYGGSFSLIVEAYIQLTPNRYFPICIDSTNLDLILLPLHMLSEPLPQGWCGPRA